MKCDQVRELLPGFVYGDLSPQEVAAVQDHLQSCADCNKEEVALQQVQRLLQTLPPAQVQVDLGAIYGLATKKSNRSRQRWRRLALGVSGAAAAIVILVLGLRTEIRLEAHQVIIRWAAAPAPAELPSSPVPVPSPQDLVAAGTEFSDPAKIQDQLQMFGELILGHQQEISGLQTQLRTLQRQLTAVSQRWNATERDVAALSGSPALQPK